MITYIHMKYLNRIKIWLRSSINHKISSIHSHLREIFVISITPILKKFKNFKSFRMANFRSTIPNSFLVSNCDNEIFIISSSDKAIGRYVYVNKTPHDFAKLDLVIGLLPGLNCNLLIDIGANIGTICIPAITRNRFKKAIAIEPEPTNFSLLSANISLNSLGSRVVAHNVALGASDDESLVFELSPNHHGDHRIRCAVSEPELTNCLFAESSRNTITVSSTTFNKIVGPVDSSSTLIWIDTQGYEGFALSRADLAMVKNTPICLEFWPYGMKRAGSYFLLKEVLLKNNYSFLINLQDPDIKIPLDSQALDSLYKSLGENGAHTDILVL
jgi:FkbM family methyltransferase